jgi:hypothetical protein
VVKGGQFAVEYQPQGGTTVVKGGSLSSFESGKRQDNKTDPNTDEHTDLTWKPPPNQRGENTGDDQEILHYLR